MKNCLLLFVLLMVAGCHKSKNYTPLTIQQSLDSMHIIVGAPYIFGSPGIYHTPVYDTVYFYGDGAALEKYQNEISHFQINFKSYISKIISPISGKASDSNYLQIEFSTPSADSFTTNPTWYSTHDQFAFLLQCAQKSKFAYLPGRIHDSAIFIYKSDYSTGAYLTKCIK